MQEWVISVQYNEYKQVVGMANTSSLDDSTGIECKTYY